MTRSTGAAADTAAAPPFFDSHAHLADPQFAGDADEAVSRARTAGARGLVCIGESVAAAERARAVAARHPGFVWFTAGVHPHDAPGFDPARDLDALRALLAAGAVAVGECGLDYHYGAAHRDAQRGAFRAQLALAAELRRPVVVHTREAEADSRTAIDEARAMGVAGVLHCFTGSAELAEHALDSGWYISFSGVITFKRWTDDALLRLVPDDRLLIESDAPYLAPVPHRGRRNEPAWCVRTLAHLAAVRAADPATLGEVVTANARRFFRLP